MQQAPHEKQPTADASPIDRASAPASTSQGARPHATNGNHPYKCFVDTNSEAIDLIDSVAYALYKRRKLAFVTSYTQRHGNPPGASEVENFILASTLPESIEAFKAEATDTLRVFSEEVLTQAEAELVDEYNRRLLAELKKTRPFLKSLAENILANLGALAVTALIILVIYGSQIGVPELIGRVFGYEVKKVPAEQPAPATIDPPGSRKL